MIAVTFEVEPRAGAALRCMELAAAPKSTLDSIDERPMSPRSTPHHPQEHRLARAASVTAATASGHLAQLLDGDFVVCEARGATARPGAFDRPDLLRRREQMEKELAEPATASSCSRLDRNQGIMTSPNRRDDMMETPEPALDRGDVFEAYKAAIKSLHGGNPNSKRLAQKLTEQLPVGLSEPSFVLTLFECFSSDRWQSPKSPARSNWLWRQAPTPYADRPGEVRLEREIHKHAGQHHWSFQMATMSGVFGDRKHQRRQIDLVHRVRAGEYEFIELKVGSNNPVSAAFEILSYGLAYCQARRHVHVHSPSSEHDVLRARKIRLIVLAPAPWYVFHERGHADRHFHLKPLEAAFNAGLDHLRTVLPLPDLDDLSFEFRKYASEPELIEQIANGGLGGHSLFGQVP